MNGYTPHPSGDIDTGDIKAAHIKAATVAVSDHTAATVVELLQMCEEFLRTAGPTVHAELRGYLAAQQPPADPCWLIDMLGLNALHLRRQTTGDAQPRENWQ